MHNYSNKRVLFIAYFYPPVSGSGLPGVQRIIKFIRNFKKMESYVLTLNPDAYPEYMSMSESLVLPIKNEEIDRTCVFDLFGFLISVRNLFKKFIKSVKKENKTKTKITAGMKSRRPETSMIREVISILLNYPDFARPWFLPGLWTGVHLIKKNKIDIIFATGMPWTSLILGWLLKKITGKKLVVDFRDPWVGNPYINKGRFEKYLDEKFEAKIVNRADLIVVNTDMLCKEMTNRYRAIDGKIVVLPNGYDEWDFQQLPKIELPKDKFVIAHAGLMYLKRDPIAILRAIECINKEYPELSSKIQFHQIGNIDLDYDLMEYCTKRDINNHIIIAGLLEHKKCLGYLASSDVLLLIQPNTKNQIPSKLYEYIYLEKPIITMTEKDGALASLISKYDLGYVFGPNEYRELSELLIKLAFEKFYNPGDATTKQYPDKDRFNARNISMKLEDQLNLL
jgi:glycosyltransferase involved in cell wall biosynthesis